VKDARFVAVDQLDKSALIAGAKARHQLMIGAHAAAVILSSIAAY
jgi:hypothetical protein